MITLLEKSSFKIFFLYNKLIFQRLPVSIRNMTKVQKHANGQINQ